MSSGCGLLGLGSGITSFEPGIGLEVGACQAKTASN